MVLYQRERKQMSTTLSQSQQQPMRATRLQIRLIRKFIVRSKFTTQASWSLKIEKNMLQANSGFDKATTKAAIERWSSCGLKRSGGISSVSMHLVCHVQNQSTFDCTSSA